MVSGSEDGGVWVWDVSDKRVLQRIEGAHEGVVLGVDARGYLMVSCGVDGCVRVWEVESDDKSEGQGQVDIKKEEEVDGVADGDRMEM